MARRKMSPAGASPQGDKPFPPSWAEIDDPTGAVIRRAVEEGRADVVAFLIARGVDVDTVEDFEEPTALMIAVEAGRADLVTLLLNAGADPDRADRDGEAPLMIAARNTDRAVFDLLAPGTGLARRSSAARVLANGERLARPDSGQALASLLDAANAGDVESIRSAIVAGADLDGRGRDGLSALHLAACLGDNTAPALTLLNAGADPNVRDEGGGTPLYFARTPAMMAVLAAAGADLDARSQFGTTTLHDSAARGEPDRCAWLIATGANLVARDDTGRIPLHWAASARKPKAFLRLVEAGADLGAIDDRGDTPLALARSSFSRLDDQDEFRKLKKALVRGHHLDGRPDTLLAAVVKGQPRPVLKLLTQGVDINALGDLPARHGVTPLYLAATAGDLAMCHLLLQAGADPTTRIVTDLAEYAHRKDRITPLEAAIAKGHRQIVKLLEAAKASRSV